MNQRAIAIVDAAFDAVKHVDPKFDLEKYLQEMYPRRDEGGLPPLISATGTCLILGCSRMTLWRLGREKKLVPAYVGRRPMYSRSEITKFIEGGGARIPADVKKEG